MSTVCEAFGLGPAAALREIERAPDGLIEEILETRAYVAAWREVERFRRALMTNPNGADLEETPWTDLAEEIDAAVREAEAAERRRTRESAQAAGDAEL